MRQQIKYLYRDKSKRSFRWVNLETNDKWETNESAREEKALLRPKSRLMLIRLRQISLLAARDSALCWGHETGLSLLYLHVCRMKTIWEGPFERGGSLVLWPARALLESTTARLLSGWREKENSIALCSFQPLGMFKQWRRYILGLDCKLFWVNKHSASIGTNL